jgi:hypothetical protein
MKNYFEKIYDFFRYDIPYGVENLVRWFPIIWQDRDWDHVYLYEVMKKKLEFMENLQEHHGMSVNSKKYAKQIRVCKCLLDRLSKDEYIENALFWHEKKYGESEIGWKESDKGKNWVQMYTYYPKLLRTQWDDPNSKVNKDYKRCIKHSDMMQIQDLDMLFKNMRKYIQGWWD